MEMPQCDFIMSYTIFMEKSETKINISTPQPLYNTIVGLNIFYYIIQVQQSNKFDIQTI